jgi:hypothetical protein
MHLMTPMDTKPRWNDDRLDEFAANVDKRFDRVDQELARVNGRLDDLMKVAIAGFITVIAVLLTGILSMIAMQF